MKATYGEITHPYNSDASWIGEGESWIEPREIFKDPITDDGTKKSKKGLLCVTKFDDGHLECMDGRSWIAEQQGELKTVFKNGELVKRTTLEEIRRRLNEISGN